MSATPQSVLCYGPRPRSEPNSGRLSHLRQTACLAGLLAAVTTLAAPVRSEPPTAYAVYRPDGIESSGPDAVAWHSASDSGRDLTEVDGHPKIRLVYAPDGKTVDILRLDGQSALWQTVDSWGTIPAAHTVLAFVRVGPNAHGTLIDGSTLRAASPITVNSGAGAWKAVAYSVQGSALGGFIVGENARRQQGLACDIAEIDVYDRALTPAERDQAVQALSARWGNPVDLPESQQPQPVTVPNDPRLFRKTVLHSGDYGVHSYRIPGLTTTPKGTLLATFDMRNTSGADLPNDIDVGLSRSIDGGATWSAPQRILSFDKSDPAALGNGVGDPCVLVDRVAGKIFVAATWSHGNHSWTGSGPGLTPETSNQLMIAQSSDDGVTWSKPVSITPMVKDPAWNLLFEGPGRGIQTVSGALVFPAQYKAADAIPHACLLYSQDHGKTWHLTPAAIPGSTPTSESQVAQLPNGSLLLTMRNETHTGLRAWARWDGSLNSGTWSAPWYVVTDPTCMASLVQYPDGPLVFSNPNNKRRRVDLTVRTSYDGGRTWSKGRLLEHHPSAYSCLTVLENGSLGILYENGVKSSTEQLSFARFPLEWVDSTPRKRKAKPAARPKKRAPRPAVYGVVRPARAPQAAMHRPKRVHVHVKRRR